MDSMGDSGALKFVAGLVIGAVIRSLAPGLLKQVRHALGMLCAATSAAFTYTAAAFPGEATQRKH
jgi:uncharacterized membrane protein required for colicin V production